MTSPIVVPQANPGAGYRALQPEINAAIARALDSGQYVLGHECSSFEAAFAAWLGVRNAVGCGSGTDALALALRAIGAGPGMAVATVSHTAVATVAAIEMAGAVPILLDIEPQYYTLDPAELETVLKRPPAGLPPIGAVVAVHLYGQMAAINDIRALCDRYGVILIEDCAQAHGAALDERHAGTIGDLATFSFYPTKNLGGLGDGGLVTTSNARLASRVAALRQYGWQTNSISQWIGVNSRLDEIQAAILRAKLPFLDANNARRQAIAEAYDNALADGRATRPARRDGARHVFHQYVLRLADRDHVRQRLRVEGVGTGIHYAIPVHLQPAYGGRVALGPGNCLMTEQAAAEILSLPIYPELTDAQVGHICAALRRL